jgi:phenylacetate-CoA ligase
VVPPRTILVPGVNVFPLGIQATLASLRPRVTGEFRVRLDRPPPIDYPLPVDVEVARSVAAHDHDALAAEVAGRLADEHNFTSAVRLVPQGSISTEHKTRRVIRTYRGEEAR